MITNNLAGTWSLVSWEHADSEGAITYPYGRDPLGYIIYAPDGYMSVAIMNPDRQSELAGNTTLDPQERLLAFETYFSYCGPYTIQGNTVTHHIQISLDPTLVGTSRDRNFAFEGNRLVLSKGATRLVWERVA